MRERAKNMTGTVLLLSALVVSTAALAQTVSIRADEWYPNNGKPGSELPGFAIELAQKTFTKVDYRLMPWERAVEEVRAGRFDCVVGAFADDTPDFIFPTENWGVDQTGVYVASGDTWKPSNAKSLMTRKVGVVTGYSYGDEIDDLIDANPQVFKDVSGDGALDKNVQKLVAGRIDTVLEGTAVMDAKLKSLGLSDKVKRVGTMGEESPLYIACSPAKPGSKALVEKVDATTKALRASGELAAILAKYGLKDWK